MTCPNCNNNHVMSETKKESVTIKYSVAGSVYAHTERDIENVKHRCFNCGHEWESGK